MFAEGLLDHFCDDGVFKLVVVYDTKIKGHDFEEYHSKEQADTLIPHQVLATTAGNTLRGIHVWSADTDVLIVLLDLVSIANLEAQTRLKFLTGKCTKYREIDGELPPEVKALEQFVCQVYSATGPRTLPVGVISLKEFGMRDVTSHPRCPTATYHTCKLYCHAG